MLLGLMVYLDVTYNTNIGLYSSKGLDGDEWSSLSQSGSGL